MSLHNILVENNNDIFCRDLNVSGNLSVDGNNISIINEVHVLPVIYSGDGSSQNKTFYFQKVGRIVNVLIPQIQYTIPVGPAIPGYFSVDISALSNFTISNLNPDGTAYQAIVVENDSVITTGVIKAASFNQHIDIFHVTPGSTETIFTGTGNTLQGNPNPHLISYFH